MKISVYAGTIWDRIVENYQNSVFRELIDYFDSTYFSVNLGEYQHFSISTRAGSVIKNLILGLAVGMIVACIVSCYLKTVHGGFIRKLLQEDCTAPEKAKTLLELGFFSNISIRKQLIRGGAIAGLVRSVNRDGEEIAGTSGTENSATAETGENTAPDGVTATAETGENTAPDGVTENADDTSLKVPKSTAGDCKPDFVSDRFYIPEDLRYKAEVRYDKAGSGVKNVVITAVIAVVATALICRFLPQILGLADAILGIFQ